MARDVRAVGGCALLLMLFAMVVNGDICDVLGVMLFIGMVGAVRNQFK